MHRALEKYVPSYINNVYFTFPVGKGRWHLWRAYADSPADSPPDGNLPRHVEILNVTCFVPGVSPVMRALII